MRIALIILVSIHGIIHLFGFLKAFNLSSFNAISQPISKQVGLLWLTAFLLFAITAILLVIRKPYWAILACFAIVLSQFLIFLFWKDARFGSLINVIILVAIIPAFASQQFNSKISAERKAMESEITKPQLHPDSEELINSLPKPVTKWLNKSGIDGSEIIREVKLTQRVSLKMKPEQTDWKQGEADQYFTTNPPAFNWKIEIPMMPGLNAHGRDKFTHGQGQMTIKLASLIPIVNEKDNFKINQASLQRYLAEIAWFPSAALSSYIQWEEIDENSAKATMTYMKTEGSGTFYFNEDGSFQKFVAMRYKGVSEKSIPTEWTVRAIKSEERNGRFIPIELEADWKIDGKDWTWLKLKIVDIEYNPKQDK